MKTIIALLLIASCSSQESRPEQEQDLKAEIQQMESVLNDLAFEVHKPLYNLSEN